MEVFVIIAVFIAVFVVEPNGGPCRDRDADSADDFVLPGFTPSIGGVRQPDRTAWRHVEAMDHPEPGGCARYRYSSVAATISLNVTLTSALPRHANRNWSNLGMLAPRPLIESIAIAGLMVAMAVILANGENINAVLPVLGIFGVAAFRIMPSLNRLAANFTRMRISRAAVDNVLADLDLRASARWEDADGKPRKIMPSGEILFDKVSYSYPSSAGTAVNELSLSIPEGGSVAFVGESGAGKSTVINLLLGLFDPSSGTITMAGRDTRADIRAWWRHIGYVPQSIYLFDDSLRRNIAIGVEDSEIDEAALERAIKMAALGPMVGSLPQGVNSVIGEDGARISGGERQRIGIARALYRDPDVLVFDEATSALDNDTEKFIMQSIDGLRDRKTIVFIAHRLSTVRQCDRLFLMDNGVLADSGDYETLASRNAAFRRLAALEPAGPAS